MRIRGRSGIVMLLCVSSLFLLSVLSVIEVPKDVSAHTPHGPDLSGVADEWHSFHKDLGNTGTANCDGPLTNSTIWSAGYGGSSSGSTSYAGGVLFQPTGHRGVQALNASTGSLLWNMSVSSGRVHTTPVYYEGMIFFGTIWGNGSFFAVDASDGSVLWTQVLDDDQYTAAAVVADGVVYVPLAYDRMVAMNAFNGSMLWDRTVQTGLHQSPAYEDGIIYTGHFYMQAVNASSGDVIWQSPNSRIASGVVIAGEKVCGHHKDYVICLNKTTGSEEWKTRVGSGSQWNAILSTPAVLGNRIFMGTQDGWAYALDLDDGSILWNITIGEYFVDSIIASPITAQNDVVYFLDKDLYALNATTGEVIWSFEPFCSTPARPSPLLVNGILYADCGGGIRAIGDAAPSPPEMLDASLTGSNETDVTLWWSRSDDDGAGAYDVTRYVVYRSTNFDGPYADVAIVPATGAQVYDWTCSGCGEGDPDSYFYYVEANDSQFSSRSRNRAGKFTRPLALGPSLVSIPLIPSDEGIETVLQTVKYDKAWFYDSSSEEWKWHMTFKTYRRGLWNINHTMGLWVNATEECNLTVAGIVPAQTTIHLREGWNLISFPSFNSSYTVADLKVELPVERVEAFDPTAPPHFLRVLQDSDVLLAGEGYWVKVSADATWVVSNG